MTLSSGADVLGAILKKKMEANQQDQERRSSADARQFKTTLSGSRKSNTMNLSGDEIIQLTVLRPSSRHSSFGLT
jgi:hypothetical protein